MKYKILIYDKLIILIVAITIISLIGTWTYYSYKNHKIEDELHQLNIEATK